VLEATGIAKSYGGVRALSGAGLTVRAGSVHALLGENGAGKSTLVKVIAGAVKPDEGTLRLDGREVAFDSTADAVRNGVAVVSQELSLFPDLDVLSNLFPMREPRRGPFVRRAEMARRARPVLAELGLDVSLREPLGSLALAERQLVEVAKALVTEPRVLILDEPTSALDAESEALVQQALARLTNGRTTFAIAHRLSTVVDADRIVVLKDGRVLEQGNHRELMARGGYYRSLVERQTRGLLPDGDASLERPAMAGVA
jgi:ABC-type sugar transport system ATPase subunit